MNGVTARPVPDILPRLGRGEHALAKRIVSAAVLAVPVLAAVYLGRPWFELMLIAAALVLSWEWCRLCGTPAPSPAFAAVAGSVLAALGAMLWLGPLVSLLVLVAAAAGVQLIARGDRWLAAGTLYIALPCLAMIWLRSGPAGGRELVYWLLVVVWASDIGAYAAGRLIGGPKLAPVLSPNKTWAGLVGGVAAAGAAGAAAGALLGSSAMWPLTVLALGLGGAAQAGDLLESGIKRRFGVKDTGTLIPGHGGLFDRVDGLIVAAVTLALIGLASDGRIGQWL